MWSMEFFKIENVYTVKSMNYQKIMNIKFEILYTNKIQYENNTRRLK